MSFSPNEIPIGPRQYVELKARATIERDLRRARYDYATYAELVGRDQVGNPIQQAWLHRSWWGHVAWCWVNQVHPVIMAPWGHGKSVQMAVLLLPWLLGLNENLRIKLLCNIDDNAKARVQAVQELISGEAIGSPALRAIFPNLRFAESITSHFRFRIVRESGGIDPSLEAMGVFGAGVSKRADLIIADDVVDQNNAILSPARKPQVIEQMHSVWLSRLEPPCLSCRGQGFLQGSWLQLRDAVPCPTCGGTGGGRMIGIGTAWAEDDFWADCQERKGFCVLVQRINEAQNGISCEIYGKPEGVRYPSLAELVTVGVDPECQEQLQEQFLAEQKEIGR